MKPLYVSFTFILLLGSTALNAQFSTLQSGTTSFTITPDGITSNKSGASFTGSYSYGFNALQSEITGIKNLALGYNTLKDANNVAFNVAVGSRALEKNNSGFGNTAYGYLALHFNTSGNFNTAFGNEALYNNTSGTTNLAIGLRAMQGNTTGRLNIAIGNYALESNGSVFGASSVDSNRHNIAIGHYAMYKSANFNGIPAQKNLVVGYNSANEGGWRSTILGSFSGMEQFQEGSTVVGHYSNRNSSKNVILGDSVLATDGVANGNTIIGNKSMKEGGNLTSENVILGHNTAGKLQSSLGRNTFIGNEIATGNLGYMAENTIIGHRSAIQFKSGIRNVAMGRGALPGMDTASNNTAIGWLSGFWVDKQDNSNTFIGNFSTLTNRSVGDTNSMAIGHAVTVNDRNKIRIGNNSVTSIGGYANWTTFSDRRLKENFDYENTPGLQFILDQRLVKYILKNNPHQTWEYGLIAQEVENSVVKNGTRFPSLHTPSSPEDHYSLDYSGFTMPLIHAIKELDASFEKEQERLQQNLNRNKELRAQLKP